MKDGCPSYSNHFTVKHDPNFDICISLYAKFNGKKDHTSKLWTLCLPKNKKKAMDPLISSNWSNSY